MNLQVTLFSSHTGVISRIVSYGIAKDGTPVVTVWSLDGCKYILRQDAVKFYVHSL